MKAKIIGHRGAAGLALENTLAAFRAGIAAGADYLEMDIRLTKDGHPIICHDTDLNRVSDSTSHINSLTLAELQTIKLKNGEHVPSLIEVLETVGSTPLILELKEDHSARVVLQILEKFPAAKYSFVSFRQHEIALLKGLSPKSRVYLRSHTNVFDIIFIVKATQADGLDINFWILNPLTYFWARFNRFEIMVYTVDSWFLAAFIHFFYPRAMICTNNPQLFKRRA